MGMRDLTLPPIKTILATTGYILCIFNVDALDDYSASRRSFTVPI